MESTNLDLQMYYRKLAPTYIEHKAVELLSILLADVTNDVEVAARDSGLSDASFVRLRRAMDRVAGAQRVLETLGAWSVGASDDGMAQQPSCGCGKRWDCWQGSGRRSIRPGRWSG